MAWREIERSTTTAPRELHRTNPARDKFGLRVDGSDPSVGGTAVVEHVTWRCYSCRKLAVTQGEQPSACCCGAK